MSEIINVLIAFDAYSIAKQYPDASKDYNAPTYVDQSLIYMTARQDRVVGTSGAELNFRANPRDIIRWRETTLSLNSEYCALLYRYVSDDPLISTPQVVIGDGSAPDGPPRGQVAEDGLPAGRAGSPYPPCHQLAGSARP
ncbi:AidA/PixA family protein [Streptomyces sp. OE57]|uniref:AidA/PixA family protein n=1 Tax=Streptomyces lacaronensis TaxID=3379885 RepID=UPI0039B740B5